ncbi:hypothetical protein MASR2M70_05830 [Bacillota bacterium]
MAVNSTIAAAFDDCEYHEKTIRSLEAELPNLPEGSIHHRMIRGISRFYHFIPSQNKGKSHEQRYLRAEEQQLIQDLLRKKYINMCLKILRPNLSILKLLLKIYVVFGPDEIRKKLYVKHNSNGDSIPFEYLKKKNADEWQSADYARNMMYPEQLAFMTQGGLMVRSKSELVIAGYLESNNIPFRYEAQLITGSHYYYPDFTIINPQDNRTIYWEHFGMVENEDYELAMNKKLKSYKDDGITQWDNLIVTFETKKNPLNTPKIQKIIKAFLLP